MNVPHFLRNLLVRVATGLFTLVFAAQSIFVGIGKQPPAVPEDFTPVLRFVVCSDVHISEEGDRQSAHFASLLSDMYAYADTQTYNTVDALVVAGDMTGRGEEAHYEAYNKVLESGLREGTVYLPMLGNHEFIAYRDEDPTVGYTMYKKCVREEVDSHTVLNGYHFITVSYSDDAKTFTSKCAWLKAEIEKAVADTPDKPVFVFQHPHPFLTVYGSIQWLDMDIRRVLNHYPNVVDFSGHSHYSAVDLRSIWQGSFTAVGTGSVAGNSGNPDYLGEIDNKDTQSGTYWTVEVDADGNIRMRLGDVMTHSFFANGERYLANPVDKHNHYYTWANMKALDKKPEFQENSEISAENKDGATLLTFPEATEGGFCQSYRITVKSGSGKKVFEDTVLSDLAVTNASDNIRTTAIDLLPAGTYECRIVPCSSYGLTGSALTGTVTVE